MELINILDNYRQDIQNANAMIDFAYSQYANGRYKYNSKIREFISKNAFLKIFISWESFLEQSFVNYMLGKASVSGKILVRYINPTGYEHAQKILIGTQKYVDWANPEIIRRISQLYFENGEPFNNIIGSINSDLLDLKTIRNASAHISSTTSTQLDAVASRKLNKNVTNIDVSDFLLSNDPNSNGTKTILDIYIALLETAAINIANC